MCGIAGVLSILGLGPDELAELAGAMGAATRHRGPDGDGVWAHAGAGIGLAHRRLSIVDLSEAGHQPMASADGRFVITFNGEVYNRHELAARLESAGVVFRGRCDTEVLVEAMARWGVEQALGEVDGMFALGVWDRAERRLTLARDRFGEKPLYYGTARGDFVFGSGLDALRAHPGFDDAVDRDALCGLLRYKYVPAPLSIYRDARKLLPGHLLVVDRDGPGEPRPWWSYASVLEKGRANRFVGSPHDAAEELDRRMRVALSRRLDADVPVGAFLSGGVDSSTVVAVAQQVSERPVQSFTIGSPDAGFDEAPDARRVAEHLGTDHHEMVVTGADALAAVPRLAGVYDEPFADSSQIPTLLVSELARSRVKVALTGDAADELFGGYNRYTWLPGIDGRLRRVPRFARGALARAGGGVPQAAWDRAGRLVPARARPRQLGLKVHKAAAVAGASGLEAMYLRTVSHWSAASRAVIGGQDPVVLAARPQGWPRMAEPGARLMAVDALTYLPDDILAKVDRAMMAVGLEGRIPFLDLGVVELAASLPFSWLVRDGRSKAPVRDVLERYVPRELVDRPKAGFGIPLGPWLRGPLRTWGEDLLDGDTAAEYFDLDVVRSEWARHLSGRADNGFRMWDVLMFLAWAEERRPAPVEAA